MAALAAARYCAPSESIVASSGATVDLAWDCSSGVATSNRFVARIQMIFPLRLSTQISSSGLDVTKIRSPRMIGELGLSAGRRVIQAMFWLAYVCGTGG